MRRALVACTVILTLFVAAIATVTLLSETATRAEARCLCPLIYAPVVCDNGKTYPNQCEADCHHAKNCVPYGI